MVFGKGEDLIKPPSNSSQKPARKSKRSSNSNKKTITKGNSGKEEVDDDGEEGGIGESKMDEVGDESDGDIQMIDISAKGKSVSPSKSNMAYTIGQRIIALSKKCEEFHSNPFWLNLKFWEKISSICEQFKTKNINNYNKKKFLKDLDYLSINNIFEVFHSEFEYATDQFNIISKKYNNEMIGWNQNKFQKWLFESTKPNEKDDNISNISDISASFRKILPSILKISFALYLYRGLQPPNGSKKELYISISSNRLSQIMNHHTLTEYAVRKITAMYAHVGIAVHSDVPKMLLCIPCFSSERKKSGGNLLFGKRCQSRKILEEMIKNKELLNLRQTVKEEPVEEEDGDVEMTEV